MLNIKCESLCKKLQLTHDASKTNDHNIMITSSIIACQEYPCFIDCYCFQEHRIAVHLMIYIAENGQWLLAAFIVVYKAMHNNYLSFNSLNNDRIA